MLTKMLKSWWKINLDSKEKRVSKYEGIKSWKENSGRIKSTDFQF